MRDSVNTRIRGVRITVLKKHFHKDFVEQYTARPQDWTECKHFEVGQEFLVPKQIPWQMPEGFCGWAWADMQKLVLDVARGGKDVFVTCCTDGYRPVIFKLECVEDGTGQVEVELEVGRGQLALDVHTRDGNTWALLSTANCGAPWGSGDYV